MDLGFMHLTFQILLAFHCNTKLGLERQAFLKMTRVLKGK